MDNSIKLCSIDGCNKKRLARGFCRNHYHRLRKHGDPLKGGTSHGEPLKFLKDAVKNASPDVCIIWPYALGKRGYGMLRKDGKLMLAHRLALIMHSGTDYPHLDATHGPCHNPSCANPLHLSWATKRENAADRHRDGTAQIGERHALAKLTEREALKILRDQRLHREIAADYGVHQTQISNIKAGRRWAHLTKNVNR